MKFTLSTIATSLAITAVSHCHAFSTSAPPASPKIALSSIFSAPIEQFQRNQLKSQIIKAAETKDEELILTLVEQLAQLNPTPIPTLGLLGYTGEDNNVNNNNSNKAPLEGAWKLIYTNAKDAEAPARTESNKGEKFGDQVPTGIQVKTGQRIVASTGTCTNFIQLTDGQDNDDDDDDESSKTTERPFDKLEITIQLTPLSNERVRLDFRKGKAFNRNAPLPFLREFQFNFPPAGFYDLVARTRGLDPRVEPQSYFDVLYLDGEFRCHRTGEGKIFVQRRDE